MAKHKLWEKIKDAGSTLTATVLLFTALAGIAYEVVHKMGYDRFTHDIVEPEEVLIFLVSFLCAGLGLERLIVLGEIIENIRHANEQRQKILTGVQGIKKTEIGIAEKVSTISTTKLLFGKDEIESAARKLVESCSDNHKIRATSQYFPGEQGEDPLSDEYFKTIAKRLSKAKPRSSIEYQVVLPASARQRSGHLDKLKNIFSELEVSNKMSVLYAKGSWPFELLIGGKAMIIAFPGGTHERTYEMAVEVTDHDFVERANEWFLEVIGKEADA